LNMKQSYSKLWRHAEKIRIRNVEKTPDQNNTAPTSAVRVFKTQRRNINKNSQERFWNILTYVNGKKNWSLFRRNELTGADVFFIFQINNKTIIEFGCRKIYENDQALSLSYQPQPSASIENTKLLAWLVRLHIMLNLIQ
jgi:hypothetical protein